MTDAVSGAVEGAVVPGAAGVFRFDHWVGGRPVPAVEYADVVSPATGVVVGRRAEGTADDVAAAVESAAAAAAAWRAFDVSARARLLTDVGRAVRAHRDEFVALDAAESGKPEAMSAGEVEVAAAYFEFYAGLVNVPAGEVIDVGPGKHAYVRREPYGVVGIITPWNVPLNQAARGCAPALATGNVVVSKPSEFTSGTTVLLARVAAEAGLPDGVLNVVLGTGPAVGEPLVRHPAVRKVSFTGSVAGGRAVARAAADKLVPATLELGGKSANIVFADADLDAAARVAASAFLVNTGQVCSAGTRLLVQRSVHDEVVAKVVEQVGGWRPGVELGPLITAAQYDKVTDFLARAKDEGVNAAYGGEVPGPARPGQGLFVAPTVFVDVDNSMRVAREEAFGPILVVIPFEDEAEAVAIANDSEYGLVAGLWTRDLSRAIRVADALEVGQVTVNDWATGHIQLPFGGHKNSGYGREKGLEAMHHFTQTKAVVIRL